MADKRSRKRNGGEKETINTREKENNYERMWKEI